MILSKKNYSIETIQTAFNVYYYSPMAYNVIRDRKLLILPHKCTLQKMPSAQNFNIDGLDSNRNYLRKTTENFSDRERLVNIQIDEIYINPIIEFKNSKLVGCADNNNCVGTTVLCFMVNSVFGSLKLNCKTDSG